MKHLKNVYQHLNKISIVNKKLLLSIMAITTLYAVNAQIVNIPDTNFKSYLLGNTAINTNADGEIQVSEATAFTGIIVVTSLGISDLTGIEAFTEITRLWATNNLLTSLDVSANTNLEWLIINENQLTSIDISTLTKLENFWCQDNLLTSISSLDLSVNRNLEGLICSNNLLTSLDLSANRYLDGISCSNNLLTSLDVSNGNNINLGGFYLTGNPNLFCIKVDRVNYSTSTWSNIDPWCSFSRECDFYIPDNNFEQALINLGYDTVLDDTVRLNKNITNLDVSNLSISDLTGIEAFPGLLDLDCSGNSLTSLEVHKNSNLIKVLCQNNQLTSMHINNGNNTAISNADFNAINNPNLTCITVDDATWSATNWTNIDVSGSFSEYYCSQCFVNIPDPIFKAYLLGISAINTNGDSEIHCSEASDYTRGIDVDNMGISDLTGIEAFTSIDALYCSRNQLTSLDLSANTHLEALWCNENSLTTLDITKCPDLRDLYCHYNSLTSLDISENIALDTVWCYYNSLTTLDTSDNLALLDLYCYNNSITSLDLSQNLRSTRLLCQNNALTSLNRANDNYVYTATREFDTRNNPDLFCITVDNVEYSMTTWFNIDPQQSFDVDCECVISIPDANFKNYLLQNTDINTILDSEIQCSEAAAFSGIINVFNLNISDLTGIEAFTALTVLQCSNNSLSTLDVSKNTALTHLLCANNELTTLDVSQNTALVDLFCSFNSLTSLDVSQNSNLTRLWCRDNQLTSLKVTNGNNTAIPTQNFNAINNLNLTCIEVDDAVWSDEYWIYIDSVSAFSEDCDNILSIGEFNLENISIHPNPTKNEFKISGLQENSQLEIYNITGQLILKKVNYIGESIDITRLLSAIYFVKISNSKGTIVMRLIRE